MAYWAPASSRGSASTIGICRKRSNIAAAGRPATPREWFADYAQLAVRRLGDRVKHWATFNEPNCACVKGYGDGGHAPGIRGRLSALTAIHVMNLAHGRGVEAMRAERADLLLGNIFNFHPYEPASDHEEDEIANPPPPQAG